MTEISIRQPVRGFIVSNFLLGAGGELEDGTELMEAGILDSTGVVELVAFLEGEFSISISDSEIIAINLNSINNISRFVIEKAR